MQFVKNHRRLVWYVRTAANEQWARFDLKKIFGVSSLRTAANNRFENDNLQASDMYYHGGGGDDSYPVRKPLYKDVGVILPPTRQWATDKTADLMSR